MKSLKHLFAVAIAVAVLVAATGSVGNDYYLRIAFMMCVYYLCGIGMNVCARPTPYLTAHAVRA